MTHTVRPALARLAAFALGLIILPTLAAVTAESFVTPLSPEREHAPASVNTVRMLRSHYQRKQVDDDLSRTMFDRYLKLLDPTRSLFTASDISGFGKYRTRLDDALLHGDLGPGFALYNRYQQRQAERLAFHVNRLEESLGEIDFTRDEWLETDRRKAPWVAADADLHELWRLQLKWALLNLVLTGKTIEEAAGLLDKRYRNQLNRLQQARSEDAFQAYLNALGLSYDPHTTYLSPMRSEDFSIDMNLSLEGIGAALQLEDEYTKVVRIIAGGPADRSNELKANDRIIGVAQGERGEMVDVVGWRLDEVVKLIRGPKGTIVRLDIIPSDATSDQQTRLVKLRRDKVRLEDQAASSSVLEFDHQGKPFRIGVIELPTFYIGTSKDVHRLLGELQADAVDGVLIDLRNNGGGSLEEANQLTGLFIDQGPTVLIRRANGKISGLHDPDKGVVYAGPLGVLVNRHSASASEIFAGAIQDYRRGLILGSRTYGKGTVQTLQRLDSGGRLKLTIAKFYRVSGGSTQHHGIMPDIEFPGTLDPELTGESALDGALPWDTIERTEFEQLPDLATYLPELQARHAVRSDGDIEFTLLRERMERFKAIRARSRVSLNVTLREEARSEDERFRLDQENRRRNARGDAPLAALDAPDDEAAAHGEEPPEETAMIAEGGRILADLIELTGSDLAHR